MHIGYNRQKKNIEGEFEPQTPKLQINKYIYIHTNVLNFFFQNLYKLICFYFA